MSKAIHEFSCEGAYGFEFRATVRRSRRGYLLVEISGFRWAGQQGGRVTRLYRVNPEREEDLAATFALAADRNSPQGGAGAITDMLELMEDADQAKLIREQ